MVDAVSSGAAGFHAGFLAPAPGPQRSSSPYETVTPLEGFTHGLKPAQAGTKLVEFAEEQIDQLGRGIQLYNHMQDQLKKPVEAGSPGESLHEARLKVMAYSRTLIRSAQQSLSGLFHINAPMVEKGEDGKLAMGRFQLSVSTSKFSILIDSEKGPQLGLNGGALGSATIARTKPTIDLLLPYTVKNPVDVTA